MKLKSYDVEWVISSTAACHSRNVFCAFIRENGLMMAEKRHLPSLMIGCVWKKVLQNMSRSCLFIERPINCWISSFLVNVEIGFPLVFLNLVDVAEN